MKVIFLLVLFLAVAFSESTSEDGKPPQKAKAQRTKPGENIKEKLRSKMKGGQIPFGGTAQKPERQRKTDKGKPRVPPPGFKPKGGPPQAEGKPPRGGRTPPGRDGAKPRRKGPPGDRERPDPRRRRAEGGAPPPRGPRDEGKGRRKRPPPGPKGEGKGGPGRKWGGGPGGKGPKGKLPNYDRFGPCQACYAVVGSLDTQIAELTPEERLAYNFEEHCMERPKDYEIIQPPKKGSPIVQGPGLPDLRARMGDEVKPADPKLTPRFMKDFHKVCSIATKDVKKVSRMFTPPKDALEDERRRNKWKSGVRRNMCTRYCRKGKSEL